MWDLGNYWGEGKSTPMSSYLGVMHEIHVLLVDHDADGLMNTSKMLEMCQYRVSVVEFASAAIAMLTNGKVKVDFVLANINSPDLHGFKLLQLAINMAIPIILMSVDDNAVMAMRAIENGAYMYIKKPVTMELLRCLWQHVMRERIRVRREREQLAAPSARGVEFREVNPNPNRAELDNSMLVSERGNSKNKSYYKGSKDDGEYDSDINTSQGRVRRKVCTEWTQDLHFKFMNAVEQLGEGRCFPKEILDLMNVPGLTRMQVASHLQKCRNDNWRSPDERKSSSANPLSEGNGCQQKLRRFGSMPRLGRGPSGHPRQSGEGSKALSECDQIANIHDGDVETIPHVMSNTTSYTTHQQYGALVPPNNINAIGMNSSNPRHPSADDYYYYPDMDCLIQSVPRSTAMEHPHSTAGVYQFEPIYGTQDQTSINVTSMDNRSQWTSSDQNSNFGSDHSEARGL